MNKRILVVDDEEDLRATIAEALQEAGFVVFTANNGVVGLETALKEKPDLILLDVVMPEMDGHTMLHKLRQDPWGKDVRVIMLTSMDSAVNVAAAYEHSATGYIIKVHNSIDEIVKKVRLATFSEK